MSGVRRCWCCSRSARQASWRVAIAQVKEGLHIWIKEVLVLQQEC
jgi:hypothetical protein